MPRAKSSQNPVETDESAASIENTEGFDETLHNADNLDVEKVIKANKGELDDGEQGEVATRKVEFVKYVGKATHRTIESGTWPTGVKNQDLTAEWGFFNGFKIPAASFTDDQLHYLLEAVDQEGKRLDPGFELVEEDVTISGA
ncbi:hypothetical protein PBI_LAMBO_22 [Gordonia phage Lambo]|uniref:Uncharacterized protein n=1 Tax=Gordonia phage Lambo TaxID=2599845 RepID=A0A5J6TRY6_9CAUD|nr:hypothetical protein HWC70_gp22 [Gordonia phage Lambo]QFG13533.1 hypothetical protein PBI_LAMBO_22 [Gordonia phage Lambo]